MHCHTLIQICLLRIVYFTISQITETKISYDGELGITEKMQISLNEPAAQFSTEEKVTDDPGIWPESQTTGLSVCGTYFMLNARKLLPSYIYAFPRKVMVNISF